MKNLQNFRTPFILIDRTFDSYDGSFIQYDDYQGGYQAASHLIKKGRKKIALLKGNSDCSISSFREKGFRDALNAAKIEIHEHLIVICPEASSVEGYEATSRLLAHRHPPDGIVTITDQLAVGALRRSRDNGLQVPKDLSIIGYSNSEISKMVSPKLTTINQDGYEMGKLAKQYLVEMCLHKNVVYQKVFPSELITRQST